MAGFVATHLSALVMALLLLVIVLFFAAFERSRPGAGQLVIVAQL